MPIRIALIGLICAAVARPAERVIDFGTLDWGPAFLWPDSTPADCPFERSRDLAGLIFTGRGFHLQAGDTWYPSWAGNDTLYSPYTDGDVDGVVSNSNGAGATTGQAYLAGGDPRRLSIHSLGTRAADPAPYQGRYPAGGLIHQGTCYYSTYCLAPSANESYHDTTWNWPVLGPMPGFRVSLDYGKTWQASPLSPSEPLFPEPSTPLGPVKMGAPHFVDFGKDMEHSPDGKAYLLGMGAGSPDRLPRHANLSWITGDQVYLARVVPGPAALNDGSQYEYYAGKDAQGNALWTRDFQGIKPLLDWNNHMGCVTATYDPALKKYLMCVTDGWPTFAKMDTYVLEADQITGPWRMVTYLKGFGEQAYFVNFPSKFIDPGGRGLWLCYSANFAVGWNGTAIKANPPLSGYGLTLQHVILTTRADLDTAAVASLANPLRSGANIARISAVTASSVHGGYAAGGAVDGVVSGFPQDPAAEWASAGENAGAWLRLTWKEAHRVDRVWLFDRPNDVDQMTAGKLAFSDGSSLDVGSLPDGATQGKEVAFPAKTVSWIEFRATGTKPGSENIGLSEIGVFEAAPTAVRPPRRGSERGRARPRAPGAAFGSRNALGRIPLRP